METVELRIYQIEDDLNYISTVLTKLELWLDESNGIFAEEVDKELGAEWATENKRKFGHGFFSKSLYWKEHKDGKPVEFKIRVDVCDSFEWAAEHHDYFTDGNEYDGFVLDVYGLESAVMQIGENAKSIAPYANNPRRDIRIVTAHHNELLTYLQRQNGDKSKDLYEAKIPAAWEWSNCHKLAIGDILLLKNSQPSTVDGKINATVERHLYRWLYSRALLKYVGT